MVIEKSLDSLKNAMKSIMFSPDYALDYYEMIDESLMMADINVIVDDIVLMRPGEYLNLDAYKNRDSEKAKPK